MDHKKILSNSLCIVQRRQIQSHYNRTVQRALQVNLPFIERFGLQNELQGHTGCVNCLEWSDCGQYLASGSDDYNVIIWDATKIQQKNIIQTRHDGNIFAVKFLPSSNNRVVASGAADATIKVHDVEVGKPLHDFSCHLKRVKKLATSRQSPFVLWSASEDGSVREYDLRVPHNCSISSPCKNVLINLQSLSGPTKEAKCLQLHPFFPERIAVGATDPFVRLYDRRKLNLTDFQTNYKEERTSGGCISYFGPGHLFNRKNRMRSNKSRHFTTTHVSFSPNGDELLQYLGGEHIFTYKLNEERKPLVFNIPERCLNEHQESKNGITTKINVFDTNNTILKPEGKSLCDCSSFKYNESTGEELPGETPLKAMEWKQKGNNYFSNSNYFQAVVCYNNALVYAPNNAVLFCNRAAALLKRAWDGDIYAALRDCHLSIQLDPTHSKAYYRQAKCLFELKWYEEANLCLQLFKEKFLDQTDGLAYKKFEAEVQQQVNSHHHENSDIEGGTYHRGDPSREESRLQQNAYDYDLRFVGACNTTTDIKEANYFGEKAQFIVAGSDCGCMLLWDRSTTDLIEAWQGDESIVNCVQPHPINCLVATSGLDPVVRLWSPCPLEPNRTDSRAKEVEVLARSNQKRMNTDPLEEMLRTMGYRPVEDGADGDSDEDFSAMQCRTS